MKLSEIVAALEEGKTIARRIEGFETKMLYKFLKIEERTFCANWWEGKSPEIDPYIRFVLSDEYSIYEEPKC